MATDVIVYQVTDRNNNTHGIVAPIPTDTPTHYSGRKYYTDATAIVTDFPEFNPGVTWFTNTLGKQKMVALGFAENLIVDCEALAGDIWTFNNGSYLTFSALSVGAFLSDGTSVGTIVFNASYPGCVSMFARYLNPAETGATNYQEFDIRSVNNFQIEIYRQVLVNSSIADASGFWEGATPYSEPQDPFAPGGGNDGGGGTGDFDNTSDTIPVPSLPSVSITDSGFLTLFVTNQAGLRSLANYLWSDLFSAISPQGSMEETITTLKKVVANPYDAILGCSLVPVTVPTGTSKDVKLYGVLNSGVTLPVASSQYVAVDCGTLNINEYWGAYLDYAPYTKVTSLYLPYVGVVSIDTDLIMDKALQVIYHVDILSGQCVAYIVINGSVEFQYMGHCATPIPVTSIDYSSTIQAGLGLVGSIASIAGSAVGGALGGGGAVGALTGGAKSLMGEAGSIAQNVMNSKPDIKSGSGIGGMGGMMSVQKPFLIIERPRQSLPKKDDLSQNHWTGYPSNMARRLGDLSGYTEVAKIFVNRTTATAEEKEEITRLLTEGVYI